MLFMPWIAFRGLAVLGIAKEKRITFLIFSTLLLILTPLLINYLLSMLIIH
jgi:hypothetical protein